MHSVTGLTPFESWFGEAPDLSRLIMFGARVCVRRTSKRRAKLDRHDFTGIFLGFSATDRNIRYLDETSGVVKTSTHAVFDEAWYTHTAWRPPGAQFLYDLGIDEDPCTPTPPSDKTTAGSVDRDSSYNPRRVPTPQDLPFKPVQRTVVSQVVLAKQHHIISPFHSTMDEYGISKRDMTMVYMSPDPYYPTTSVTIDLQKF